MAARKKNTKGPVAANTPTVRQPAAGVSAEKPPQPQAGKKFAIEGELRPVGRGKPKGLVVTLIRHQPRRTQAVASASVETNGKFSFGVTGEQLGLGTDHSKSDYFSFGVFDSKGLELLADSERSAIWQPTAPRAPVVLDLSPSRVPGAQITVDALLSLAGRESTPAVRKWLVGNKVTTVADLRAKYPALIEFSASLKKKDAALDLLGNVAALSIVDAPANVYLGLARDGIRNARALADTPPEEIARALEGETSLQEAARIQGDAALFDWRASNAVMLKRMKGSQEADIGPDALAAALRLTCRCDCASATSAQAYLSHLLRVAVNVLRYQGARVSLGLLQTKFRQPLRDLPATCESAEKEISQARIAIEVLRAQFNDRAERPWYLEAAYLSGLDYFGMTYEELSAAMASGDPRTKITLVHQKGLGVGRPSDAQIVDMLYRDLPPPGGTSPLTEAWLNEFFGLRSTLLAPLDPDIPEPRAVRLRKDALHATWLKADCTAPRPLGYLPIIDPQLVEDIDIVDRTPTVPRIDDPQRWTVIDMLKRRQEEYDRLIATVYPYFGTPPAGVTAAQRIRDLFAEISQPIFMVSVAGSTIPLPSFGFRANNQALDFARLDSLNTSLLQGVDVSADLASFGIDEQTVRLFVDYVAHLERGPVTSGETDNVRRAVVSHIKRVGFWPEWLQQEKNNALGAAGYRLMLDPDRFRLRVRVGNTPDPEWVPRPGLAEAEERVLWEDILRTRTRQFEDLITDLQQRVIQIEHDLLPELRHDLLLYAHQDAEKLTDQFQLDFKAAGCQRTTRVTQAIQTMQGLLLGARNGLLDDAGWSMTEPEFDAIWRWLGTIETWRAAITAFLNPERLLRPSFLQDPSPGFSLALEILRDADPIASTDGRRAHDAFADYLNDVASLEITAGAERGLLQESGATERKAFYLLARTTRTGAAKLYFSVALQQRNTLADQSWWRAADPMNDVDQIFGLALCGRFLVALTGSSDTGAKRIEAWRQPLADASIGNAEFLDEAPGWEGPFDLALPADVDSYDSVAVRPATAAGGTPTVIIEADESRLFLRPLNVEANGWSGRFRKQANTPEWRQIGESPGPVANSASFACLNYGTSEDVDERCVMSADVDGDGADEIIAFPGPEGFWSMKLFASGTRQYWKPMTERGTETFDYRIPPRTPGGGSLWFACTGDFDGDNIAEVVAVIDTTMYVGPQNYALEIYGRKWNTPTPNVWNAFGAAGGDVLDYAHPRFAPLDFMVGRFTQEVRDEIAATFYPVGAPPNRSVEIVIFTLDNGTWMATGTTKATSFQTGGISSDSRATCGRFSGQARSEILVQQSGATGNVFFMLTYNPGAGAFQKTATLNVGGVSVEPRMLAGDFDDDGSDELALIDGGTLVRFFKYDGQQWFAAGQVNMTDAVATWAKGDFEGDGIVRLMVTTDAAPSIGRVIRWNLVSNQPELTPQQVDLTEGTGRTVRALAAGRFGKSVRSDVAALGDGNTFYTLTKLPRVLITSTIPQVPSFKPTLTEPYSLFEDGALINTADGLQGLLTYDRFKTLSTAAFAANATNRSRNRSYVEEAYFFLVVEIALRLQSAGDFAGALSWMRLVARLKGSTLDVASAFLTLDQLGQLPPLSGAHLDPLDAHTIARERPGSYTRYVVESTVRLLAGYGDAEFTLATSQSIPFARELYLSALALLNTHPYAATIDACESLIESVLQQLAADPALSGLIPEVRDALAAENDVGRLSDLVARILAAIAAAPNRAAAIEQIRQILAAGPSPETHTATLANRLDDEEQATATLQLEHHGRADDRPFLLGDTSSLQAVIDFVKERRKLPFPQYTYCIPPSATLVELKRRIELNLSRLRNCQDITGNDLVFVPIGAESDPSPANQLQLTGQIQPLPYRYITLVERAKHLVEIARQIESSMLGFIEAAERKRYDVLAARRDLSLARTSQQLRAAEVQQAVGEVGLATLQRDRTNDQISRYTRLLRQGLSMWETAGLVSQWGAFGLKQIAAVSTLLEETSFKGWAEGILTWGAGNTRAVASAQADAFSALGQAQFSQAQFERRQQSWGFSLEDARRDHQIAEQQIAINNSRLQAAQIEQRIANLQADYAADAMTLLTTKSFANEALYEWMASVLEGIYRFFLQQATNMARLAELQLAFERQELSAVVKRDYWTPQRGGATPDITSIPNGSDSVKGLTGAARLLRDIYQLDQFAFTRNKRKQVLTERISLSRHDPVAFEDLRATGRMVFDTPREMFDRRTPGCYLRLIQRVRLTLVALVPPTEGYRATLSNNGISRVVIPADDTFKEVTLQRGYDQVTYTSNADASDGTVLDLQPELLMQFEGSSVDTRWLLEIPRSANSFDYNSLADVILTIEYTALFDSYLKAKTLGELPPTVARERVFSLRQQFPDSWYELHNPDAAATPLQTTFNTVPADFPPNLTNVQMTQITLLVRRSTGPSTPITLDFLGFAPSGSTNFVGGGATTEANGLASTRRANGVPWQPIVTGARDPAGTWRMKFSSAHRNLFLDDQIDDILLSVSIEGASPQ